MVQKIKKILISVRNEQLITFLIKRQGHKILSGTASSLISLVQQSNPNAIILDDDCYKIVHELKSNIITAHIPILMIMHRIITPDPNSRLLPADDYLQDPIDINEFPKRLELLLQLKS